MPGWNDFHFFLKLIKMSLWDDCLVVAGASQILGHAVIVSCWEPDQDETRQICKRLNDGVDPFEYRDLSFLV